MRFSMYTKPLSAIIRSHSMTHHSFTDDLQSQMSAPQDNISELLHSLQSSISDVKSWATANMLKLNDNKTELMLVTSNGNKHLHKLPTSIIRMEVDSSRPDRLPTLSTAKTSEISILVKLPSWCQCGRSRQCYFNILLQ